MNRKRNGIATQWNITGDRKWNSNPCYNMTEPLKHYAKWKKKKQTEAKGQMLYESIYMKCLGKSIKTETGGCQWAGEWRKESDC